MAKKQKRMRRVLTEEKLDDTGVRIVHLENHWNFQLKRLECQRLVQERQHKCWSLDPIKEQ
jgi:hypothetical protein